ncbi:multidrug efflux SMR transporter [Exiguobacterium sp. s150]|uniref:DMT family transporter n=1 Tax=Exiguobacterium sp. s150 TaxID=2751221 RepID=UPI001BEABE18|nr:multidrug efflux SMR transporter [Exiguobacterium sp. s150]
MGFLYLAGAIISEVFGSSMLKLNATSSTRLPIVGVALGYVTAFYLLSLALLSIPLSFAYAFWSGVGTAATALIGFLVFNEQVRKQTVAGIGLVIVGLVLMKV